jgi:hypothetical protein
LVTEISTLVGEDHVKAEAYISSGTSYSKFAIMDLNVEEGKYEVTRLVAGTLEPQQEGSGQRGGVFYSAVSIVNSSDQVVSGTVNYPLCSNDNFTIKPRGNWHGPGRGACLITEISAFVGPDHVRAQPYESSGTGYSTFAIIHLNNGEYQVTRRVSSLPPTPPSWGEQPEEAPNAGGNQACGQETVQRTQ